MFHVKHGSRDGIKSFPNRKEIPTENGRKTAVTANETSFKPGNPGGPGRPKGMRNKLSEAFIKALADDFEDNGKEVIEVVRESKPDAYLNVIGKLMPKLMELSGPDGNEIPLRGTLKVVSTTDK